MKALLNLFRPRPALAKRPYTRFTAYDQETRARSLQAAGLDLYNAGQYADAVPCLESALSLWTILGNFQAEQHLFQWLGSCYWELGQVQAAYCCYQEALTLAQALGDRTVASGSRHAIARFLNSIGYETTSETP